LSRRAEGPVLKKLLKGARRMSRGVKSEDRVIRTSLVVEILSGDRVHRQFPTWLLSRRDDGPVLKTFKGRAARCLAASTVGGKVPPTAPLPKRVLKARYLGYLGLVLTMSNFRRRQGDKESASLVSCFKTMDCRGFLGGLA